MVITGAPAGNHLAVGHTTVAVPPDPPFVSQRLIVCPDVGFEKVSVQAFPEVSVNVKLFPVDQSTVLAVVQVVRACVATVVSATGMGEV